MKINDKCLKNKKVIYLINIVTKLLFSIDNFDNNAINLFLIVDNNLFNLINKSNDK